LCGLPPAEAASLLQNAAGADGALDLRRFGAVALRRIRPVLSFKILANMPICFVSIFENLRGPNAVYTPWEGHAAQAIAAGFRAVAEGEVPCAVVGSCDVKTHAMSFVSLQQWDVFESWKRHGSGTAPGEGAAFLVLEEREQAMRRGARVYARLRGYASRSITPQITRQEVLAGVLQRLEVPAGARIISAGDGDVSHREAERAALAAVGLEQNVALRPKSQLGNLFAAAAPIQVVLAALLAARDHGPVLANCFGHGTEQAAFLLEAA
jgi:3-oxoacyl-(acyl-carrier-protein) synthase